MRYCSDYRCAVLVFSLVCAACSDPAEPTSSGNAEVTGTGLVRMTQVSFRTTVDVRRVDGVLSGTVATAAEIGGTAVEHSGAVNCLRVSGRSAWIGSTITTTNNQVLAPLGSRVIVMIRDLGGPGQDIMHAELYGFDAQCTPARDLEETVVSEGDYSVR